MDNDGERQKFYESVGNGVRTVPQIYVDGERIGGFQDLIKSHLATNLNADF
jgi:glutaredoxin